jgi:ribosome-associated protein
VGGTTISEQDAGGPEAPPSKSARKRTAEAAQQLGEELIGLTDGELTALGLPETLLDAIRHARAIRTRGAGARQRQYIGRLMRDIDVTGIRAALEARHARAALEAARFRLIESWRARLIAEPLEALDELARLHPQIDRAEWQSAIAAARAERAQPAAAPGGASRQLFRMLRALFQP